MPDQYIFENFFFETRIAAAEVLFQLRRMIMAYKRPIFVAWFYNVTNRKATSEDYTYGWLDLGGVGIYSSGGFWLIDFPDPIFIEKGMQVVNTFQYNKDPTMSGARDLLKLIEDHHNSFVTGLERACQKYRDLCNGDLDFSQRMRSEQHAGGKVTTFFFDDAPVFRATYEATLEKVVWTIEACRGRVDLT